jgi:hypothetical protein
LIYPLTLVIFHSYINLPEVKHKHLPPTRI